MKKILLSALIAGSLCATAQTNYPGSIPGCIGRWDFANTGNPITALPDVSGNSNNASVTNLYTSFGFRNAPNKAMQFTGFNSWATVPDAAILRPSAITMIVLVRMNAFYSGNCQLTQFLTKGYPHYIPGNYGLGVGDNNYDNSCALYSPNYMQLNAQFHNNTSGPSAGNYVSTGQWYLFAATNDGTNIRYYQVPMDPNNYVASVSPIWTGVSTAAIGTNTLDLNFGRTMNPPFPYWVNGAMDEIALFNRALTNTEMQQVYDYLWGIVAVTSVPTNLCTGQPFNVVYTVNNSSFFSSTNTFTVQLSNASGSFATPMNIGSTTSNMGGTISCTIPGTVANGTGYRIRIVGSNVAYTGRDNGTNLNVTSITKPSITSNSPVCVGQTLNLSGASSTAGVTYNWNGPFSFTSNQQNISIPNVTQASGGNYTLYTTLNGCTSQIDTELAVIGSNVPPIVTSYASPGDTICVGGTAAFYALVTAGANPQYQWMKNGNPIAGETSATFVSQTLSAGDVIHCQVTSAGCASTLTTNSNSHTIAIVGKSPAGVSISASPGLTVSPWTLVTFTANVTNGGLTPTYQWKLNGNNILGANGPTWSANNLVNNDAVSVVVKSSSDCSEPAEASSQAMVVNINTSVNDVNDRQAIRLYPNPNNGSFTVTFADAPGSDGAITVLNALGQVIHWQPYKALSSAVNVDLQQAAPGLYLLKMDVGGESFRSRVVVSK